MSETPPIYGQALPTPPPPPRRTGWIVFSIIALFFLVLSVLANFGLVAALLGGGARDSEVERERLRERYVEGDRSARDKIALIDLTGVISYEVNDSSSDEGLVGDIKDQLDRAVRDKHVKAILLRIDSPGGEVVASDAIYRALADVRDDTNRAVKVIAYIETVGASGAYYAAMGTDYIVANELSITGSIGVIMQTFNFRHLMDKVGVEAYTFKSGNLKDILNPTREPTEEEKALVQNLIMEVYDKFVGIVSDERNIDLAKLKNSLADGRIYSGKQAKEAGLVDEVGYFENAVDAAKELAKIKDAKVVQYVKPFSLRQLFRIFGKNETPKIQLEISPNSLRLQSGKLYFLPPYLFQ
jgi:protease-4